MAITSTKCAMKALLIISTWLQNVLNCAKKINRMSFYRFETRFRPIRRLVSFLSSKWAQISGLALSKNFKEARKWRCACMYNNQTYVKDLYLLIIALLQRRWWHGMGVITYPLHNLNAASVHYRSLNSFEAFVSKPCMAWSNEHYSRNN